MNKNYKKIGVVGSISALVIAFTASFSILSTDKMDNAVNKQLAALRKDDIIKAYSYTSDDFKRNSSLHEFKKFVYAYSTLYHNDKVSFEETNENNLDGTINGVLYSKEGNANSVKYQLVKQDGQWKINRITLSFINPYPSISYQYSNSLNNIFNNKENRYTIKYPQNWNSNSSAQGTVILNGKPGTQSYYSSVNIQTVLTKKTGGNFSNIKEFMHEVKKQVEKVSEKAKFVGTGKIDIPQTDGTKLHGEYIVFIYNVNGVNFKQWQIVILRNDQQAFYAWAFTSPVKQFDRDLPIAREILKTWSIY